MPTYTQLQAEPWWGAQYVAPAMQAGLIGPLRVHYGLGPSAIGAAGDNNHLYGRHRSRIWDLNSIYCTDRAYGTQDARDKQGDGDWYRAVDVGIQDEDLFAASRRMDALARSGGCPGLAEWFGTFDGQNVVGWYEGHPSTSDDSHLYHLHVGVWTGYANDAATMQQLYATITGEDEMTNEEFNLLWANGWITQQLASMTDPIKVPAYPRTGYPGYTAPNLLAQAIKAAGGDVDEQAIADALAANAAFSAAIGGAVDVPTQGELEEAAFQGAQRAERE